MHYPQRGESDGLGRDTLERILWLPSQKPLKGLNKDKIWRPLRWLPLDYRPRSGEIQLRRGFHLTIAGCDIVSNNDVACLLNLARAAPGTTGPAEVWRIASVHGHCRDKRDPTMCAAATLLLAARSAIGLAYFLLPSSPDERTLTATPPAHCNIDPFVLLRYKQLTGFTLLP